MTRRVYVTMYDEADEPWEVSGIPQDGRVDDLEATRGGSTLSVALDDTTLSEDAAVDAIADAWADMDARERRYGWAV